MGYVRARIKGRPVTVLLHPHVLFEPIKVSAYQLLV